jgi:hypothetical protein
VAKGTARPFQIAERPMILGLFMVAGERKHEKKLNWMKKKYTPNKVVFKVFWLMQPHIRKNLKSLGVWSKV